MIDWLYHLPVIWMAVVVFAATFLVSGAIYAGVMKLATGERARVFKTMSPVMLTPLAVVFGLIVAFLATQVWTDVERANTAVTREASALRNVVVLAAYFPKEQETRIRALVRRHIQKVVNEEWPSMARHGASLSLISLCGRRGASTRPVNSSPERSSVDRAARNCFLDAKRPRRTAAAHHNQRINDQLGEVGGSLFARCSYPAYYRHRP